MDDKGRGSEVLKGAVGLEKSIETFWGVRKRS